jgi:dihydrofolate reductase
MRKVRYSVAMSLDGYIAGPMGEFDWIPMDPTIDWTAFMARFDTVLMGRHTFEVALSQGQAGGSAGSRTFVFSRTLRAADHPTVTLVRDDPAGVVASLRRESGKEIWLMGGGVLFRSLLEANAVDIVEVGVIPILLGGGVPFLPSPSQKARLVLSDMQKYPSGIVMLTYEVSKDAG